MPRFWTRTLLQMRKTFVTEKTRLKSATRLLGTTVRLVALVCVNGAYRLYSWLPPIPYTSMATTTSTCYYLRMELIAGFFRLRFSPAGSSG